MMEPSGDLLAEPVGEWGSAFSLHLLFYVRSPEHIHTEQSTACPPQRSLIFLPPLHGGRRLLLKPSPHAASTALQEGLAFSAALGSHFKKMQGEPNVWPGWRNHKGPA